MADYLDVIPDLAAEANGERMLLPVLFRDSLTKAEQAELFRTFTFTPEQCAVIWRLHRRDGPPPKTMALSIRTDAIRRAMERRVALKRNAG